MGGWLIGLTADIFETFSAMSLRLGEFWATYEPAQVRKFLHGRTACVRVLSSAVKAWVLAMEDKSDRRPTARRLELLREAAAAHVEYARSAAEVGDKQIY